ncbi:hypothetical protein GCM10022221_74830 [Actinocorallia aurea]
MATEPLSRVAVTIQLTSAGALPVISGRIGSIGTVIVCISATTVPDEARIKVMGGVRLFTLLGKHMFTAVGPKTDG